jgi:hypothetical protein
MGEAEDKDRALLAARHLLGKLTPEEQQRVEEGLFAEEGWFEELRQAENDLIDAYAYGSLSVEDSKRVEERILVSPEQHQRLQIAISLRKVFEARPLPVEMWPGSRTGFAKRSWNFAGGWLASGMPALLAGGIILAILLVRSERQNLALRTELQSLSKANAAAPTTPAVTATKEPPAERTLPAANPGAREVETLFLTASVRGAREESQLILLVPRAQVVHLQLEVRPAGKTQKFEARIFGEGHQLVWNARSLSPQTQNAEAWVNLWVPVNIFRGRNFELQVWPKDASERDSASYFLQISRSSSNTEQATPH